MKLTYTQISTLAGAVLAIALGAVDTWAFHHAFGDGLDVGLIGLGVGALTGSAIPTVAEAAATKTV